MQMFSIFYKEENSYLLISALILFAFILRVAALLCLENSIYANYLICDERLYHTWAIKIMDGMFKSSTFHGFAPLPAYIMAFIYKVFSPNILYIRILNIIFGVITCYIIYLIGREMADHMVGLFACLIACMYKPFIFYNIVPLKTSLSVLLFALSIYFFASIIRKSSKIKSIFLGMAIGLMVNVRPNCVVLIPFLPLFFILNIKKGTPDLRAYMKIFLFYVIGLSIAMSPFVVRKYMISSKFSITTPQAGFAFYLGNNIDEPDPYFRPVPFAFPSPFLQGKQILIETDRRAGRKLTIRETSAYWTNETIKMAKDRPYEFLWKMLQKILVLFNRFEAGDHYNIDFMSRFVTFFKFPFFCLGLILPFGLSGMLITAFKSRKLLTISLVSGIYASTLVLFYTITRFRLPFLVVLIPFSVICIKELLHYIKNKRFNYVLICSIIIVLFAIVEYLPVQGTGDMTGYYNIHAAVLDTIGKEDKSMQYLIESSQLNGAFSGFADMSLAGRYIARQDFKKARYHIDRISDQSFAAAYKYDMLGNLMISQREVEKAITAYKKSLDINSGQRVVRKKLIQLYSQTNPEMAIKENKTLMKITKYFN